MDDETSFIDMIKGMGLVVIFTFSLLSMVATGVNYANVIAIICVIFFIVPHSKRGDKR